ncbi:hypothetical protein, partial [Paenisporosarcina sp. NPDC076898]|uniref:hypothetical protein n=1 Tax=unclassified Paenisporosarcina TaxID=2642018 RepID=UPI003D084FB4
NERLSSSFASGTEVRSALLLTFCCSVFKVHLFVAVVTATFISYQFLIVMSTTSFDILFF